MKLYRLEIKCRQDVARNEPLVIIVKAYSELAARSLAVIETEKEYKFVPWLFNDRVKCEELSMASEEILMIGYK